MGAYASTAFYFNAATKQDNSEHDNMTAPYLNPFETVEEFKPGDRVQFIYTHRDTGTLLRKSEYGMVGGDWFVVWDHDQERKERPVWASNVKAIT